MGLGLLFIVVSWNAMEKLGRHLIFLSGPFLSGILLLVVSGLYYAPGLGPIWAITILPNFFIAWGVLSFMSVGWAIGAELSSKLRAKTQSLAAISGAFFAWLFSFITPYMNNVDSGNPGQGLDLSTRVFAPYTWLWRTLLCLKAVV